LSPQDCQECDLTFPRVRISALTWIINS